MSEVKKKFTFKILSGTHGEGGKIYVCKKAQKDVEGHAGDIIHTDANLAQRFNSLGNTKFAIHNEDTEDATVDTDADGNIDFDSMTLATLKAFAVDNEIELDGATSKADVLAVVKEAWGED